MNLFNLSLKNVKNSSSNYIMYFLSIVFSVFIYTTFKSIQYNEALSMLSDSKKAGINGASIVVALSSFMFIYYSNSFFLNRRKEEIGTYSLLGMRKSHISKIFIYETIIISIIAIAFGVILGFLFSKLMTMLLVKLMGELIVINMNLNIKAIVYTVIIFSLIFTIIGIRNTLFVYKSKLIKLFKKESEVNTSKNTSLMLGILGVILIIVGYIMATSKMIELNITMAPFVLIFIIPGTFLFFASTLEIILNLIKKNKMFYYKGVNLVAFSGISYNMKSNSKILATISILIATSVTILGFNVSYYYSIDKTVKENYKYSYNISADNKEANGEINKVLKNHMDDINIDKTVNLIEKEVDYISTNKDNKKQEHNGYIEVIKESDYIEISKNKRYENLKSDEYIYYTSDIYRKSIYKSLEGDSINIDKKEFKVQGEFYSNIANEGSTFNMVVVTDNIYNELYAKSEIRKLRFIDMSNSDSISLSNKLEEIVDKNMESSYPFNFVSNIKSHKEYMQGGGLMLFIGMFLSAVFLLCTGSIILFKQLSAIYDDKDRYITLKKIGANSKDIEKILSKQLKLIFLLPLFVGTVHNVFAMSIVQKLLQRNILAPILITLLIYYIGYFIYYLITLKYAKAMLINEK